MSVNVELFRKHEKGCCNIQGLAEPESYYPEKFATMLARFAVDIEAVLETHTHAEE